MKLSQEEFEKQNALDVMAYWHNLGYRNVTCEVASYQTPLSRPDGKKEFITLWKTSSNLMEGLPPGVKPQSVGIPNWERKPTRRDQHFAVAWPTGHILRLQRKSA